MPNYPAYMRDYKVIDCVIVVVVVEKKKKIAKSGDLGT